MAMASGYPKVLRCDAEWVVTDDFRTDRRYEVEWIAKLTAGSENDNGATILLDANFPDYGDAMTYGTTSDAYSKCRGKRAWRPIPQDDPLTWRVVARFGRLGRPPDDPVDPTQPWTRGAKWSIQQSDYVEECTTDINGDPIENSAGQPYDPPLEIEKARTLINVVYYKQTLKLSTIDTFRRAINSGSHWGYAAKRLRMNALTAEEQYENGLYYWELSAQIETNTVDWTEVRIDQGSFYISGSGSGSGISLVKDDDNETHTFPMALDGTGGILGVGQDLIEREHEVYSEEDFSDADLGLPSFPSHLSYS